MCEKCCSRRMRKKDISLYANCPRKQACQHDRHHPRLVHSIEHTCCPRHIRGPALNGRKMKGLPVKYLFSRSSTKRSGSK